MSLDPQPTPDVPEQTRLVAYAAFPKGNPYLTLHDELGVIFSDEDFASLFPRRGQHAYSPWRLALVTILQFRENLSDRQAAEAVRSRIDWKYLLALNLTDSGFDYSVLSEFRTRLIEGKLEALLLDKMLIRLQEMGVIKSRGRQRSDSTHILASVRELNKLEHVAETMRAALNTLALEAPDWLRGIAPKAWFTQYGRRIEDSRLPQKPAERDTYFVQIGKDGFELLDALKTAPKRAQILAEVGYLEKVWTLHYVREKPPDAPDKPIYIVRPTKDHEKSPAGTRLESPYDHESRYNNKGSVQWHGYKVHLTETCDEKRPNLLTHVMTTEAAFHDQRSALLIHEALARKKLLPEKHVVDTGYINIAAVVKSMERHKVKLIGSTMPNTSWQYKKEGAFSPDDFGLDWDEMKALCPGGKHSKSWGEFETGKMGRFVRIKFSADDCQACLLKSNCTTAKKYGRQLTIKRREQYEALKELRAEMAGEKGKEHHDVRAGIEGTISQAVRGFGLRQTRYRSLRKTRLQHLATTAAINIDRYFFFRQGRPKAKTRTSHFAALIPPN